MIKKAKALLTIIAFLADPAWSADRPNVVIIYGDDVGFGDVGVNGSKLIPTPNIDKLAESGINFTDGHCPSATCSPSRFCMLTGYMAIRSGVRILGPTFPMPITPEDYTLRRIFKDASYATMVVGKWHLGRSYALLEKSAKQERVL